MGLTPQQRKELAELLPHGTKIAINFAITCFQFLAAAAILFMAIYCRRPFMAPYMIFVFYGIMYAPVLIGLALYSLYIKAEYKERYDSVLFRPAVYLDLLAILQAIAAIIVIVFVHDAFTRPLN